MERPRFHALEGAFSFEHCRLTAALHDVDHGAVRLAALDLVEEEHAMLDPLTWEAWYVARGALVWIPSAPDACEIGHWLLGTSDGELLFGTKGAWSPIGEMELGAQSEAMEFLPAAQVRASIRSLERDRCGRLWLLEAPKSLALLDVPYLRSIARVPAPPVADVTLVATTDWGAVAIDRTTRTAWRAVFGGVWQELLIPAAGHAPVAVSGMGPHAAVLLRPDDPTAPSRVVVVGEGEQFDVELSGLENPLPLLGIGPHRLLVGELEGPPGSTIVLYEYQWRSGELTPSGRRFGAHGFDGRGLAIDGDGVVHVSTALGPWPVFELRDGLSQRGSIETYALDSERSGCVWHRVFVDACVPPGSSLELSVRTSDDLPDAGLRVPAQEALESSDPIERTFAALPFASRSADHREGWLPLGVLDRRALLCDLPFGHEALRRSAGCASDMDGYETFEGLVKAPPGRYLWLRIELRGNGRVGPLVREVRVWEPRPSLLDHLPRFWRHDPPSARAMDELLSLFEAEFTAEDDRISALPWLFDPGACPEDALPWLASFVALAFDSRLPTHRRRKLLANAALAYRTRGTVPGIELICSIIAEADVRVVEAFRMRRRSQAYLGIGTDPLSASPASVLGPGLPLGTTGGMAEFTFAENWERELILEHAQLEARRDARRDWIAGEAARRHARPIVPGVNREVPPEASDVCLPAAPPDLDLSEDTAYYRKHAHRFTVMLMCSRDDDVAAMVEQAVQAWKPAHTLHEICWLDAGFRVGATTFVGIGTRLAGVERPTPAILGQSAAGPWTTISLSTPGERLDSPLDTRFRVAEPTVEELPH